MEKGEIMPPWERYQKPDYSDPSARQAAMMELYPEAVPQGPWAKYQTPTQQAAEPVNNAQSVARTAVEQGLQGATFGFADEVADPLGAALAALSENPLGFAKSVLTGKTPEVSPELSDEIVNVRKASQNRLSEQFKQNPGTSIAANLSGALLTGGAGATTKAGTAIGNSLRTGNLAARIAKGAAAGGASGALYGTGAAEDGNRLEGARQGAIYGGVVGGALPAVGAAVSKLNTKTIVPNSEQIKQRAGELYKAAESNGGVLRSEFTNKFVDSVEALRPQTEIGRIVGGDSPFTQAVNRISQIRNKPMTLQAAQEVDELLGDAIDGLVENGKLTKEGKKLFDIQSAFRNQIESADDKLIVGGRQGFEALKEGRKLWAVSRRMGDVERIIKNAENYQVPATAIKTGFRTLARNPNRLRGYTPQEVKAINRAAKTGIVTDVLNVFGSRLGPLMAGAGGYATGGPLAGVGASAASYAASTAARKGAEALQMGRANDALNLIAQRSGMVTTQKRISPELIKQILKLPPAEAKAALAQLPKAQVNAAIAAENAK